MARYGKPIADPSEELSILNRPSQNEQTSFPKFGSYFGKIPEELEPEQIRVHLKHRTVLQTCYATGMRLAEATHLNVSDIDGKRTKDRAVWKT